MVRQYGIWQSCQSILKTLVCMAVYLTMLYPCNQGQDHSTNAMQHLLNQNTINVTNNYGKGAMLVYVCQATL